MCYYSDERLPYLVDGRRRMLTENQAETLDENGHDVIYLGYDDDREKFDDTD